MYRSNKLHFTINVKPFIEFKNQSQVDDWINSNYKDWFNEFLLSHRYKVNNELNSFLLRSDPIEQYTDTSMLINLELRNNSYSENKNEQKKVEKLEDEILSIPPLKDNIIVYRHVPSIVTKKIMKLNALKKPYHEKGFLSTSFMKKSANSAGIYCPSSDDMLKIYVPNNEKCFPCDLIYKKYKQATLNPDWKSPYENELLFNHGLYLALIQHPFRDREIHKKVYPVFLLKKGEKCCSSNLFFKMGLKKLKLF